MNKQNVTTWQQKTIALNAEDRLKWAADCFPGKIVFASALGAEDQVLIDMIARLHLAIPVITLDPGRLFNET